SEASRITYFLYGA
ncbi:putative periplasmic oligopeptide-binding protein, partial [Chlamydia psittaci 84-8471/1]